MSKYIGTQVILVDDRTDVLGLRFKVDLLAFNEMRGALDVPEGLNFLVSLRDKKVEETTSIGEFFPVTTDFMSWEIVIPVSDCLDFSEESLEQVNLSLGTLIRFVVQATVLWFLFEDVDTLRSVIENSSGLMYRDAEIRAVKVVDYGVLPLVLSSRPSEAETLHGEEPKDGEAERTEEVDPGD